MIRVTRLNQSQIYVNALMLESVEKTPDTVLTLLTGKKIIVLETLEEILGQVSEYYRSIGLIGGQVPRLTEGYHAEE